MRIITFIYFYCSFLLAWGQTNFSFERLATNELLAHNQVRAIIQDKTGFIWFGTTHGLQRYDGSNLKTYVHDQYNINSLSHNTIRTLLADDDGGIWIGTRGGGLNYLKNGKFTVYTSDPKDPTTISDNSIECLAKDSEGNLWIGTRSGGLNKFSNGTFEHFKFDKNNPKSISHNAVFSLLIDSQNRVWAGTYGGGLNLLEDDSFQRFKHNDNNNQSITGDFVISLLEDNKGRIWAGTFKAGLSIYENGVFKNLHVGDNGLNNNSVLTLLEKDNKIWIGTWGGGIAYFENNKFTHYLSTADESKSLSNNYIECLFQDKEGGLWIGTFGGGVNKFKEHNIRHFKNTPFQNSLNNNYVNNVIEVADGSLWIATLGGGLNHYQNGVFKNYTYDPNANSIGDESNTVWVLLEDEENSLWLGTEDGLDHFSNGVFKNYKFYKPDFEDSRNNIIYSLVKSEKYGMLLGTWNGDVLSFKDEKFTILYDNSSESIEANYPVYSIDETSDGTIWIAASEGGGVIRWKDGKVIGKYLQQQNDPKIPAVYSIHVSGRDSTVWVGTFSGLYKYNPETDKFNKFGNDNISINDAVMGLVEDKKGNLWINSLGGISKMDIDNSTIVNFAKVGGGFQGDRNAAFISEKTGNVYFGGTDGFRVFHPDSVDISINKNKIVFTKFELAYKEVVSGKNSILKKAIAETKEITLKPNDNIFAIEFSSIDFNQLGRKNKYAYYLENFNEGWVYGGSRNYASYSNVPAGEYTFKVKAMSEQSQWDTPVTSIKITVLPHWWKALWVKISAFLLITGGIYGFYYFQINAERRKNKQLENKVKERTFKIEEQKNELSLQTDQLLQVNKKLNLKNDQLTELNQEKNLLMGVVAHDLKAPLGHITMLLEIEASEKDSEQSKKHFEMINKSIAKQNEMITRILNIGSMYKAKLHPEIESINLSAHLTKVLSSFDMDANKKNIRVLFENDQECWALGDENYIIQIFENLISNAIKFSPQGKSIVVKIEENYDNFKIYFIDEGPGIGVEDQKKLFSPYQKLTAKPTGGENSTGLGLAIAKKYIDAINGLIWCESKINEGAIFIVQLQKA